MKLKTRKSIAPTTAPRCIAKGIVTALIITVLGALGMSGLIVKEVIRESNIGYSAMAVLILASMAAGLISTKEAEGSKAIVAALAGLGYALILLSVNALAYKGGYEGTGVTILLILGGCTAGLLLAMKTKKPGYSAKRRKKTR